MGPDEVDTLTSAWIRAVHRYHAQFEAIYDIADPLEAIVETGLFIPRFCRANPHDARMLTVFRYQEMVSEPPTGLEEVLPTLNAPVSRLITHLTGQRYCRVKQRGIELISLAVRDAPLGMVRSRIGHDLPLWLDEPVRAASTAVAELDDD